MEDQQAIRTFAFMSNIVQTEQPQSYFDALDGILASTYDVNLSPVKEGKLSPNPAEDYINLTFELPEAAALEVVIYDIAGK